MDRDEIIEKCSLDNVREVEITNVFEESCKATYVQDEKGNNILPVSIIELKLIERILELEKRIADLEKVIVASKE